MFQSVATQNQEHEGKRWACDEMRESEGRDPEPSWIGISAR